MRYFILMALSFLCGAIMVAGMIHSGDLRIGAPGCP